MSFVTECGFCNHPVRVPDRAVGASLTCRKCGSCFTAAATSKLPALPAVAPSAAPPQPDSSTARTTHAAPLPAAAAMAIESTEPTEVETPEPTESSSPPRPARRPPTFGALTVAALLFAGLALLSVTTFPVIGWLSLPLAGLGLLFGFAAVFAGADRQRGGVGLPLAGVGLCLLAPALGYGWPGWLRPVEVPPPTHAPAVRSFAGKGRSALEGTKEVEVADAIEGYLEIDDVRFRVAEVALDLVPLGTREKFTLTQERFLVIRLRLWNIGAARKITYPGWGQAVPGEPGSAPELRDAAGKAYPLKRFGAAQPVVGQARPTGLFPGHNVDDVLVFEAPPTDAAPWRLDLPGPPLGLSAPPRFRIPKEMIRRPVRQERR